MSDAVKIALIGLASVVVVQVAAFGVVWMKLKGIGMNVDGINSRLRVKSDQQAIDLGAATTRADRAEGRQEGSDSERERENS